jgi:hypothetical protein
VYGREILTRDFPEVLGMLLRDNKCVALGNGVDIFKGEDSLVFIDLEAGDLPLYDLAKYTIFHLMSPLI